MITKGEDSKKNFHSFFEKIPKRTLCFISVSDLSLAQKIFKTCLDLSIIPVIFPRFFDQQRIQTEYENQKYSKSLITEYSCQINLSPYFLESGDYGSYSSGRESLGHLFFYGLSNSIECTKAHFKSLEADSKFKIVNCMGIDHSFGILVNIIAKFYLGYEVELAQDEILNFTHSRKRVLHATPRSLSMYLKINPEFVFSFDKISVGSDFLSNDLFFELKQKIKGEFYITYGLSEMGPRVTTLRNLNPSIEENTYAIGEAIEGVSLKVMTEKGELLDSGLGFLAIKSPYAALSLEKKFLVSEFFISKDFVNLDLDKRVFLTRSVKNIKYNDTQYSMNDFFTREELKKCSPIVIIVSTSGIERIYIIIENALMGLSSFSKVSSLNIGITIIDCKTMELTQYGLHKINKAIISKIIGVEENLIKEWMY